MSVPSRATVFSEVFRDVRFPFFAVDLDELASGLQSPEQLAAGTRIGIAIPVEAEKREAFVASMLSFLRQADVPAKLTQLFSRSATLRARGCSEKLLEMTANVGHYKIAAAGEQVIWEEESLWPYAYSTVVDQFMRVLALHRHLIMERSQFLSDGLGEKGFSSKFIQVLSEYPRTLPTHIHYAAASLGAWIGGSINVQFFGYYATIRQIYHRPLNLQYGQRIGYDTAAGEALDASGMILVPASLALPLLVAQGALHIFGSLPIDEPNIANMPNMACAAMKNPGDAQSLPGFLVDKYYRTPFRARPLSPCALYGARDVLRDHYEQFYSHLMPAGLVRCKHYCVPIVEVTSLAEMRGLIELIPDHKMGGLFFRGQQRLYRLNREPAVRQLLFGDSCSDEPSLTTAASRDLGYDYDTLHFALKYFISDQIGARTSQGFSGFEEWRKQSIDPVCELDSAIMALAQHYGLPSHGLDITLSDDVAMWFATNRFLKDEKGTASYSKITASEWPEDPKEWPVVVVCQTVTHSISGSLHDCGQLSEFGFKAERPVSQSARFFQGGHSDHQNRLAEAVVCVFRLPPGEYATQATFEKLFPAPSLDPAYRLMLDFSEAPDFQPVWGRYVNRFH
jgi:hypothetical protein